MIEGLQYMQRLSHLLCTAAGIVFILLPGIAQETQRTGTIAGAVVNAVTLEPLAGANVLILDANRGAATDREGRFLIENVPVGMYSLRASMIGFGSVVQTDVMVSPVRAADVRFRLAEIDVELDGVTITAEYFQRLPGVSVSTQTQSREEIRRLPGGFEDVVRAVSILPGVAQVQAGRNDLIVRGGAPSENLFLIDNIEVANINHFGTQGATGGPQSFINLDFIDRTSFSTGGFGVQYGNRLSSVLRIDLREGRSDRLGGKGTVSASQFGLNLEGPVSGRGSFLFSARRSYLDLIFRAAGFSFVPEYWDFMGKADYRASARDRISVLGFTVLNNVRLFNDTEDDRFDNSRILYSSQNQYIGGATWRRLFRSGYATVTLGQTYVDYAYRQNDVSLNPVFTNDSYEHESSIRADIVLQLDNRTDISFGGTGHAVRIETDLYLRQFRTSFGDELLLERVLSMVAYKAAGYIQLNRRFGYLRLTGGLRGDYFDGLDRPPVFSPRLSAVYSISDRADLNAAVGRYYQTPSYIWLAANPENRNLRFIGADQVIGGLGYLLREDTRISLEGYYKKYFDYPVSVARPYLVMANTGAGYGGAEEGFASFGFDTLVSEGYGRAYGAELFLQKKLSTVPLYGTASISYNNVEFMALDGISRPGKFDQRWIMNFGGGYVFGAHWEISARFRFATGRPFTPFNVDGTQDIDRYFSERIPVNHSLDVRVDRRWMLRSWTIIAYIDIQNLYDRAFYDAPRYNTRTGASESSRSIGILPTIGVSVEF
jgi:hypothetical protein